MATPSALAQIENTPTLLSEAAKRDVLADLLADKRSPNTRHAYEKDLKDFFRFIAASEPLPELVTEFLGLDRFRAVTLVLKYKAHLIDRGLKEATINRRLAAIKSLVAFARKMGKCDYTLEDIKCEKVKPYRDTTGISKDAYKRLTELVTNTALPTSFDKKIINSFLYSCVYLPQCQLSFENLFYFRQLLT